MFKVLLACEESQRVCIEFRKMGFDSFSCDILPCSGGYPEWHLQQDVLPLLKEKWDLVIAFPPCTHLAVSGAKHFIQKQKDGRQQQGINFFMEFTKLPCPHAIENPIGIMSKIWRKPDQIIQPWWFGDEAQKSTCIWIHDLPPLKPTNVVSKGEMHTTPSGKTLPKWYSNRKSMRNKTFSGIAKAMAEQWGSYLLCNQINME
jgi:hypothetical protein